jgi:hypothetical protein
VDAIFVREVDEHVADPAEAAVPRLHCRKREPGGDGRIDCIPARCENARSYLARNAVLRRDDAAARASKRLSHLPVLYSMLGHGEVLRGADDIISRILTDLSMATRHLVCLTFDFDGISGFIARGQTSASWISRGEFGVRVGARAEK